MWAFPTAGALPELKPFEDQFLRNAFIGLFVGFESFQISFGRLSVLSCFIFLLGFVLALAPFPVVVAVVAWRFIIIILLLSG